MKTQTYKERVLSEAKSLSFSHNRDSVDVTVFGEGYEKITTIKDCSADLFLSHFEYGSYQSDDMQAITLFLETALN